jgi:pimeloyl-ACP methyl ester carboxylesterase
LRTNFGAVMAALLCCPGAIRAQDKLASPDPTIVQHSDFFVGGSYAGNAPSQIMRGQMFVEKLTPLKPSRPYPLVLISGAAQTATNWMGAPDGRKGWAEFFVSQGYVVYIVDQPARGRSAWHEGIDGAVRTLDAETIERLFTVPELYDRWPQAKLHTQWPGAGDKPGRPGDPIFDQFYASQVQYLADVSEAEALAQHAGVALLDRIGPAILVTHSQSGPIGWLIADARPKLVPAIVAIEPAGPAFRDEVNDHAKVRPWGLTDRPITYEPALDDPSQLLTEEGSAPAQGRARCLIQKAPARSLPNLRNVHVMLVTAEASYHAVYDHCTAEYLRQAGVPTDHVRLEDHGIHGNAHMMMLEKNNLQIAALITAWLSRNVEPIHSGAIVRSRAAKKNPVQVGRR